eukprot:m.121137 g.121137  ORF g.121137 m.121137 type:complete len:122 (+) comp37749_c2_seq15:288-653(+)
MTDDGLNRCYNRGCGKMYSDEDNHEKACRFHPGDPYFHDAYKGWSCCQKKSVDFTEFLNIAGCTVSFHSNVKPSEPEKPAKGKPMPPGEVRGTVKTSSRGEGGKTSMASKIKNLLKISGQI